MSVNRRYVPGHPLALRHVLGGLRHGGGDPCCRWDHDGVRWATGTPSGPALVRITSVPSQGAIDARGWGPGADWVLDGLPELLGCRDDPDDFPPLIAHDVLARAVRSYPGLRVMRTRRVFDSYAAACIEQRVTGKEAFYAWRQLVRRFGEPAPGPSELATGMWLPPTMYAISTRC